MEEKKPTVPAAEPAEAAGMRPETGDGGLPGRRKFPTVGDMLALLGIALGAQIVVGTAVMLFMLFAGHGFDYKSMEPAALGKLMAALYFCSMSITLAGILYYRRARGGSGPWARFSVRGLNPALLLWAFVLIFAVGVVLEPLLTLLPELSLEVGRGFWTILSLVVFAPVFEELICRGVVLSSLRMRYGVVTAWLVSSLFFGVLHGQPAQVIGASVIGLILGFVYLATDSMWSVMILHALNNAVAYLAMATGHGNALLIELVESRTLYVLIYIAALALTAVSGYMMLRTLRRMKAGDKNPSAA
ncbi:lysostaphin resistance A-like protein [Alistipes sp.]|uniref:CPBP family intramembrane glutamic endopeptidase n=1 Tax=Alistipes sp. TaxID=1872444 RepID=UPI003AB8DECA